VLSAAAPGSACGLLAGRALRREPARGGPQRAPHARARAKFAQCPAWLPPACRRPAGRCNKLPAREKPATTGGSVPRMQRPGPTWMRCGGERQLAAALARVSGVTRGRSAATTSAPASASAMATTPAPGAPARAQVRRSQTEGVKPRPPLPWSRCPQARRAAVGCSPFWQPRDACLWVAVPTHRSALLTHGPRAQYAGTRRTIGQPSKRRPAAAIRVAARSRAAACAAHTHTTAQGLF